ncbi:hypothetical protein A2Y85_06635 [candidate division WOR-3 bacterium RBG_13_43_14]|uniref:Uroporphyrinogen decarboxylase (URO-D) domain-containing protein n=1 Tax=candidate division WOR-3 bacterium RBG_13_43_14 TaxID=1802590 RepID=A0A1F4UFZ7_UNCW3|nr:MAG: hypothetical protein A2Y85_06635 [candidate division WOR-3 bacterium RBG_13_43_14]
MDKVTSVIKKELKYAVFPMVCADHCAWLSDIDFASVATDAQKLAEVTINACQQYNYDAILLFSDAYVEAQAMGCPVRLTPFPIITGPMGAERIDRTQLIIEAAGKIKAKTDIPVFVSIKGPFSLAAFLCGLKEFMISLLKDNVKAEGFISKALEFQMQYLDRLSGLGVNIMIGDPVASASLISPETFRNYALPSLKTMITKIKSFGGLVAIHICGDTHPIVDQLDKIGADLLSIEDISIPTSTIKMGGVSTNTMLYGSLSNINAEIETALANDHLILSTSCDIPIHTPPENIKALISIARDKTKGQ